MCSNRKKSKRSRKHATQRPSLELKTEGFNQIKLLESYVDPKLKEKDEKNAILKMQWLMRKELNSRKSLISQFVSS